MHVEVLKHPTEDDWKLCKICALKTMWHNRESTDENVSVSDNWKRMILSAGHSPIRTLQFCFKLVDIPYWVSVHLCRHVHATPFVSSQRNDRQNEYDRDSAPQNASVVMCWYMNAEELMTIARKRLCTKSAPETRRVVQMICDAVLRSNPEFNGLLVPECVYRGGVCTEPHGCGYNHTDECKSKVNILEGLHS